MSFERLQRRVARAERLLEGRSEETRGHWQQLATTWRSSWTPTRILVAGLLGGLLVGRSRPLRALGTIGASIGGTRWMQLATSVSGLLASLKAAGAAASAETAAEDAGDAADTAATVAADASDANANDTNASDVGADAGEAHPPQQAPLPPSDRRRRADPVWDAPPRPAEAATDVSER